MWKDFNKGMTLSNLQSRNDLGAARRMDPEALVKNSYKPGTCSFTAGKQRRRFSPCPLRNSSKAQQKIRNKNVNSIIYKLVGTYHSKIQ